MIKTKTIKCKAYHDGVKCKNKFEPKFNGHAWCSDTCQDAIVAATLKKVRANNAKAERKITRQKKEKLKGKAEFKKEAQAVFNRFIRLRDSEQPCISCGIVGDDRDRHVSACALTSDCYRPGMASQVRSTRLVIGLPAQIRIARR